MTQFNNIPNSFGSKEDLQRSVFRTLDNDPLRFMSFAGSDIQCFFFGENLDPVMEDIEAAEALTSSEKQILKQSLAKHNKAILPFGELQTLTISSARSAGPVRRLGEIEPLEYKLGARTIAGTMIFAMLNRDVFSQYMDRVIPGVENNAWTGPDFVDQIPPFNILISLANEAGRAANGVLIGVKITNFGTTFSVDDMYTEATYNYVATHYSPVVDDVETTMSNYYNLNSRYNTPMSVSRALITDAKILDSQNQARRVSKEFYEFLLKLPTKIADKVSTYYRDIEDTWSEVSGK